MKSRALSRMCAAVGVFTLLAPAGDDLVADPSPIGGACCFADGSCEDDVDPGDCEASGGTFQGFGVSCSTVECPVLSPDGWLVDAPVFWFGDVCDEKDDCDLRPSKDIQWVVTLPFDGDWTFSVCDAPWDTWMALGSGPCMDDIAFNDDTCDVASEIEVTLEAGAYYLTLEGVSSGACGPFTLRVTGFCILDTVGTPEGEPDCGPGYMDTFNGGCNSDPPAFESPIDCGDLIAGKYGNFDSGSRDTDWYDIEVTESTTLNWSVTGEGPSLAGIIDITAPGACDDPDLGFEVAETAGACETAGTSLTVGPGAFVLFAAPSGFDLGIPCGSDYQAELNCRIVKSDCPEDISGDDSVGLADLLAVLDAWGPCAGCPEDLNGDGAIDSVDLLSLFDAWGPCP